MRIFESPAVLVALIVLVIVLFGAKRLPDVAKSVGSSLKIFKKEVKDLRDDEPQATSSQPATSEPTSAPTQSTTDSPARRADGSTAQSGSESTSS